MYKVRGQLEKSPQLMRDAYCQTLMEKAEKDGRIVALDADLVSSSGMKPFFKAYPDRAVQCGVAEADMIGIAAGLSAAGKVPFAHSFGCFASRRVCDQIMISCAYAKQNVRILGKAIPASRRPITAERICPLRIWAFCAPSPGSR